MPPFPFRRALLCAAALATVPLAAQAAPVLLAVGTLDGSSAGVNADLSGLTGTLENGLPANILGGTGSALAWAGGNTFLGAPDRGPNATSYNAGVDDTVSYIARFNTISMTLAPSAPGAPLPFTLAPTLTATTLLSSPTPLFYGSGAAFNLPPGAPAQNAPGLNYFTGRSDNFGPGTSANPGNARLDPEGMRLSADGKTVFVSDEYGPYLYQFDRATGARLRSYALPPNLDAATLSTRGSTEIRGNTSGRTANRGMEGLAITPDGKTLIGAMQSALIQDDKGPTKKLLRIVTVDVATGALHEYGYLLTDGSGVSEITAINGHQFLVEERDGKGLGDGTGAVTKTLFRIDLAGAQDITGLGGAAALAVAVPKSQVLDLVALLGANGITPAQVPSKIEGMAFGADVPFGSGLLHTLYIANDNDFLPATSGPNTFYVVGLTDADLGAQYVPQATAVPEPGTLGLLASALMLAAAAARNVSRSP